MNVLIKSATIIDSKSPFHNLTQDILVENGILTKIANHIKNPNNYPTIKLKNLHVSQGWFDSSVSFGEPGFEDRETISNGILVAAKSGFSAIALNGNTNPLIQTQADVSNLLSKSKDRAAKLYPVGALSVQSEGNKLAELFDMKNAGAISFSDFKKPIKDPNLLKIALLYSQGFDGLVQSFPLEAQLAKSGIVNEGINSTKLGLKGIPSFAESLQISRDLSILEYTNGKLHIPTISTSKSVDLIRTAKAKGLNVSCSVAIYNLTFTDESISYFDTNFKVLPPLRSHEDINALISGLKDGTIDMVTSDHQPMDIECKKIEFENAKFGTIGLESAFGALNSLFSTKKTIELLTSGKTRFGIPNHPLDIGNIADISLFNPEGKYTFSSDYISSTSKNSIFLNHEIKGKVYGVIANGSMQLNES